MTQLLRRSRYSVPVPDGGDRERRCVSRREFVRDSLSALGGTVVLGCSSISAGDDGNDDGSPRLTARPGSPSLTPTVGLSDLNLGGSRNGTPDNPAPLFVGLHGAGGSSSDWASYPARAAARGMIFLAPDSRSSTWDLIRDGFGPDVEFLDRALRYTFNRCRIDPAHLALGGFSDGASYALSLGVSNGDLFSHLVAYSPGFYAPSVPIVGSPAIYVSHGTNDGILPVGASRDVIVPNLRDAGYDVTYEEFNGGHEVPAAISESALDWFLGTG